MESWTGKLFVFKDKTGKEVVSTTVPAEIDKATTRAFQGHGPFTPIGILKPVPVGNAGQWMDDLKNQGFYFEPCSIN